MNTLIQKFYEEIKGNPIYPFRGAFSPLLILLSWNDTRLPRSEQTSFPIIMVNRGHEALAAINETAYMGKALEMFIAYRDKKAAIADLKAGYEPIYQNILKIYEQRAERDLSRMSEDDIIVLLRETTEYLSQLTIRTMYIEMLDYEMISASVPHHSISALNEIWERATHPCFLSFEIRWQEKIVDLLDRYSLKEAAERGRYMFTDYYKPKDLSEIKSALQEQIINRKSNVDMIMLEREKKEEEKIEFEKWKKTLHREDERLVEYIQYVMEARDVRKDPIAQSQVVIYECAAELARRANIEESYILSVVAYEFERGIEWLKEHADEIRKRRDGCIILMNSDASVDVELGDFESGVADVMSLNAHTGHEENLLRGQSANRGIAKGRIRVLLDLTKDPIFNEGEILVTSMTRPEFVPYMKRAAAVITNEGGITCHAAIVSRELGIPCVTGTKFATHLLHDGDLVEVNADEGLVTIIEKSTSSAS